MIKQYCIFSLEAVKKMNGARGKLGSQAGHAYSAISVKAAIDDPDLWLKYQNQEGGEIQTPRITLFVETEDELKVLEKEYASKCATHLVTDAGKTVFGKPTVTCLGIGPISEEDTTKSIKSLSIL